MSFILTERTAPILYPDTVTLLATIRAWTSKTNLKVAFPPMSECRQQNTKYYHR